MKGIFLIFLFSFSFSFSQNDFNSYNQLILDKNYNLEMVPILGGEFLMGSPLTEKNRLADEGPERSVKVDSFWMAKYETTWDLFNLFVYRSLDVAQPMFNENNEVNIDVDGISGATTPYVEMSFGMGIEGYPAICMTQLAAVKFCEWLSAMTGHFYRLPTEAEWEYACRAGSTTSYSFGNTTENLGEYAWYASNSDDKYQPVGTKKPNTWGLYDMHGNVAEWTLDQYVPTSYRTRKELVKNPFQEPSKIYPKVVRGGSWMDVPKRLRSAARRPSTKKWKMRDPQIPKSKWWHTDAPFVGFRVVRPVKTPTEEEQRKYWNYESTP